MFDEKQQITYWKEAAEEDIETAEILFEKNKFKESLFFCHLSIEKILKSNYVKVIKDFAPKTHKLKFLTEKSNIQLNNEIEDFFGILMNYQLEGRYPDYFPHY